MPGKVITVKAENLLSSFYYNIFTHIVNKNSVRYDRFCFKKLLCLAHDLE